METTKQYKLTIKVKDTTGETTFVMFNREAAQVIGVPIERLLNDINKNYSPTVSLLYIHIIQKNNVESHNDTC